MHGLMMDSPLTITSLMKHAEKFHGGTEIVSVTNDNPRHRYTYTDAFARVRKLANSLQRLGAKPGDRPKRRNARHICFIKKCFLTNKQSFRTTN